MFCCLTTAKQDIAEVITRAHLVGFTDLAKDCLHTPNWGSIKKSFQEYPGCVEYPFLAASRPSAEYMN